MPRFTKAEQLASREVITKALQNCTRDRDNKPIIYTILRSVARSGMQRKISAFVIVNGEPVKLSWHYDRAVHASLSTEIFGHFANTVRGCGMDMGDNLAEHIAAVGGVKRYRHEWF